MKNHRKPRTAVDRKVNQKLQSFGTECDWWDGGYPECFLPWSGKCKGNPFICKKLYYQHLASAKKIDQQAFVDFEQRENR